MQMNNTCVHIVWGGKALGKHSWFGEWHPQIAEIAVNAWAISRLLPPRGPPWVTLTTAAHWRAKGASIK